MNVIFKRIKRPIIPTLAAPALHYLIIFSGMLTVSLIGSVIAPFVDLVSIALLYLLPVFISAARWGRWPSYFAATVGVVLFDFFFVPPQFAFKPANTHDYVNLSIFYAVAIIMGLIGTRLRDELEHTSAREKRTLALYAISEEMSAENDLTKMLQYSADKVYEAIQSDLIILMPNEQGDALEIAASSPGQSSFDNYSEYYPLFQAFMHGQFIGERRVTRQEENTTLFFPVQTEDKVLAVLAVRTGSDTRNLSSEHVLFVEAFANLAAAAISRIYLAKEAESARRQAESKKMHLAAIVESSADGIMSADLEGRIISWNQGAEVIYGYAAEEVLGRSITKLVLPRNLNNVPVILGKTKNGQRVDLYETIHVRKNGEIFNVSLNISPMRDASGTIVGMSAIARDITESKKRENELRLSTDRLRALSARLESIREEERTNLARDIHDELGQRLTGLMMDLVSFSKKPPKNKDMMSQRIKSMADIIDDTIRLVRRISAELRPGILDDLGLIAAMEWQLVDFKKRTDIICDFSSAFDDAGLDRDLSTVLFRVFQETLTNIIRHAQATRVSIEIYDDNDYVTLIVEDNGKGISEDEVSDPKSLGLIGIRERVYIFGGDVQFSGNRNAGTRVVVKIPCSKDLSHYAQNTGS
ncbi:MAG: PAS domain S-box protein [Syntrophorhabdus sp.]